MPKRAAILQSSYIPWKGYFDLIHDVDVFVFLDDVQYTRQDWRNRNRIKTAAGVRWLTIPVGPGIRRRICDVALPRGPWAAEHWRRIESSYARAPHFDDYRDELEAMYLAGGQTLSEWNQTFVRAICGWLGITTEFADSRDVPGGGRQTGRLIEILQHVGATTYVSGPAARAYLEPDRLLEAGVELRWKDYAGYPEYRQLYPPFVHEVTVLDLLFHTGPKAQDHIWGWR